MSKSKNILFGIVIIALVIMRFLYLDQDAPSYMIGGICQEDEPYYTLGAISRYNAGHDRIIEGFEHVNGEGLMVYSLPLTYISLNLIGNTYWGFRLPVAIIGLFIIWLLYRILKQLKTPNTILVLVILYVVTDFYFFLFSRFQTPQIYSLLGITWVLWLYFKYGLSSVKGILLIGFFTAFAVVFIYVYNIFLVMVFGLLIIRSAYLQKSLKPIFLFASGFVLCTLMYIVTLFLMGTSLTETIKLLTLHGGGVDKNLVVQSSVGLAVGIKKIYAALMQLPATNLFRYNLPVLFMFLFSIPFILYSAVKMKSEKHIMYLLFIGFVILQSCFAISYPFKKLIIIFPLVVIILADVMPYVLDFYRQMNLRSKIGLVLYSLFIFAICILNYRLNNSQAYWDGLNYGYYENTGGVFNSINIMLLVVSGILLLAGIFSGKLNFTIPLSMALVLGMFLIVKYCFMEKTFFSRDGFSKAAHILNSKGVIMSACYASQFYTQSKPALGCYADVLFLGKRYKPVADSLFGINKAEYTIKKIMPSDSFQINDTLNLDLITVIPMKYYSFRVYRFNNAVE